MLSSEPVIQKMQHKLVLLRETIPKQNENIISLERKLQSMTKLMGKTAIWAISCFYPLPTLNNVEKQQAKLAPSHVMGSQHCIGGKGDF